MRRNAARVLHPLEACHHSHMRVHPARCPASANQTAIAGYVRDKRELFV